MKTVKLSDLLGNRELQAEFLDSIRRGEVVIYPTDTLYGIGCLMENEESVKKVVEAKQRDSRKPFSIIAPSVDWIMENCMVTEFNKSLIAQLLPGPYTIVLRVRKESKIPKYALSLEHTIGLRIPRHKLTDIVREAGLIIISTSVNLSGEEPVTKLEGVPEGMKNMVSFAVDAGELKGSASRVFDLTTDNVRILRA